MMDQQLPKLHFARDKQIHTITSFLKRFIRTYKAV
jgi:hypothetical protein